jgi:hypothetical protein
MLGPCDHRGSKEEPRSLRIRANAAQQGGIKKKEREGERGKDREGRKSEPPPSVERKREREGGKEIEKEEVSKFVRKDREAGTRG